MKNQTFNGIAEIFVKPIVSLSRFEWALWIISAAVIALSFAAIRENPMTLAASLVGVSALIFLAKGAVVGQVLILLFSLLYGWVSFEQRYYGEMLTYLGMTAPMAIVALVAWVRHPFEDSGEVAVEQRLSRGKIVGVALLSVAATALFGILLALLNTPNWAVATASVTTSFAAASLTYLRSPYYALGYAANDVVLIVLWIMAAIYEPSCLPMVLCFAMFLINDLYGFVSWRRMAQRQMKTGNS